MADEKNKGENLDSPNTMTDDQIVTERKLSRRSFLATTGILLGGATAIVAGARPRRLGATPQSSDPDQKQSTDPDRKDPDKKKGTDPDRKDPDRKKGTDPDRKDADKKKGADPDRKDPDKKKRTDPDRKKPSDPDKKPSDPDKGKL
jgi:hypothetical protein